MDRDNQMDKRLEEIRLHIATTGRVDTGPKEFIYIDVSDASWLLEEIDRLQGERDTLKEALSAVIEVDKHDRESAEKSIQELTEEARRWLRERNNLLGERDKAIAGLRWYANKENYHTQVLHDRWGPIVRINEDEGERAITILKELGL